MAGPPGRATSSCREAEPSSPPTSTHHPKHPHLDFQMPYLKAYFGNLGVPPENLHLVAAELTRVDVLPQLAGLEDVAAASHTRARATLTELAAV
ncbi:hypothetical protein [Streptomyces prunicolor]|uniref:Uncharacterized protein n=1 Tax=Streptomyces prunicolor TaxID=67348 RepID=A0ABU4F909_9ACTN|nr:hypothetical protein [Streptomyces prunicolor]MDV7217082.1 hypothetical protein [Streptomyces prunicolor]